MNRSIQHLNLVFRKIGDHHLQRFQHCKGPGCILIEYFPGTVFKDRKIDVILTLGNSDPFTKEADRFRRKPPTADADQAWHARIVPAFDMILFHQLDQFAFAENGVLQVEP